MTDVDPSSTGENWSDTGLLPGISPVINLFDLSTTDSDERWHEVRVRVGWTARRTPGIEPGEEGYQFDIIMDNNSIVTLEDLTASEHKEEVFNDVSRITLYPLRPTLDSYGSGRALRTFPYDPSIDDGFRVQYRLWVTGVHIEGGPEEIIVDGRPFDLDFASVYNEAQVWPWDSFIPEVFIGQAFAATEVTTPTGLTPEVIQQIQTAVGPSLQSASDIAANASESSANAETAAQNAQGSAANSQTQAQASSTAAIAAQAAAQTAADLITQMDGTVDALQSANDALAAEQARQPSIDTLTAALIEGIDANAIAAAVPPYKVGQRFVASDTGDSYHLTSDDVAVKVGGLAADGPIDWSVDANGDLLAGIPALAVLADGQRVGSVSSSAEPLSGDATDFNSWTTPGWAARLMSRSGTNGPPVVSGASGWYYLLVIPHAGGPNLTQLLVSYGTTTGPKIVMFGRSFYSGDWADWTRMDGADAGGGGGATTLAELDTAVTGGQLDQIATDVAALKAAPAGGGPTYHTKILTANQVKSEDTVISATGELALDTALDIGSYWLEMQVPYEAYPSADMKHIFTFEGGAVANDNVFVTGHNASDASPFTSDRQTADAGIETTSAGADTGNRLMIKASGYFEVTADGVTPTWQWAQNGSHPTASTVFAGAFMRVEEL